MIPVVNLPGPKSALALLDFACCGARVFGRNEHHTSPTVHVSSKTEKTNLDELTSRALGAKALAVYDAFERGPYQLVSAER
jgi:hypothetical protein